MEAVAKFKNCPVAPRKMRMVADVIRGMDVEKALNTLKYTRKEGALWLDKVLTSAVANWSVKAESEPDEHELFIKEVRIDQGVTLKRFRPAPHGRAHRIRKRTNHIVVIVENRVALATENAE
jgi:large subunit ribosomal protein L22